ncbi:restriction endonuclease [bacterium]|nr:restriction endonuclease [bacterium]
MALPDYESIMLPLLKHMQRGIEFSKSDLVAAMARHFDLTNDELVLLVKSGTPAFGGRVHWALQYMMNAKLVDRPARATYKITARGKELLSSNPPQIDIAVLRQFPEFVAWQGKAREKTKVDEQDSPKPPSDHQLTPDEQIDRGYTQVRSTLAAELIEKVKSCSPRFFEQLVVDLLVRMGYGGSVEEAARVVGKSGDGGIDGIIKEDKLGLDIIYVQAKRWENVVGAGSVRDFSGSLDYHGAKKGVFITTSQFTKDAREFVTRIGEKKVVLVDGFELAQLMIDHDIGVSTVTTYTIKRLDSDYFEE